MTVPSYFNPYDIVFDKNTGNRYMVSPKMLLIPVVAEWPYDMPDNEKEIDYHTGMELVALTSAALLDEKRMKSYGMYTGNVSEKPVDIEEEDWEEYKKKNSINIYMVHNPIFDNVGVVVPQDPNKWQSPSPLESYKLIFVDPSKP
jgi:hypothetical protein